ASGLLCLIYFVYEILDFLVYSGSGQSVKGCTQFDVKFNF
ncbi:hypothetical protein Bhyg_15294, partial [Pseudolycoriella hygida]